MENIVFYSFLLLSVLSLVTWYKHHTTTHSFVNYLYFVFLIGLSFEGFKTASTSVIFIAFLLIVISFNWILSRMITFKWSYLIGLISSLSLLFWQQISLNFLDYPLLFNKENVLFIPFVGAIFPLIIKFKVNFISKYLNISKEEFKSAFQYMSVGILLLFAHFFGGIFGLFLVAFGHLLTSIYLKDSKFSIVLISIAFVSFLVKSKGIEIGTVLQANGLIGLFFGVGISKLILVVEQSKKIKINILFILLSLSFLIFIIFIESIKEHLGGMSAFVGLIIGMLVFTDRFKNEKQLLQLFLLSFTMGLGLIASSKFSGNLAKPMSEKVVNQKFETENVIEIPLTTDSIPQKVASLQKKDTINVPNPILGKWQINSSASKLSFELGTTESLTTGEFGQITGTFELSDKLNKNKINVELPLKSFTTYNDYRDESLMSKDFLAIEKQAVLTFESLTWKKIQKKYLITGNFMMKGISQIIQIELKIVGSGTDKKGNYLLISGSSELNRTKFDMTSDPKIGDLVAFKFQLELRQ